MAPEVKAVNEPRDRYSDDYDRPPRRDPRDDDDYPDVRRRDARPGDDDDYPDVRRQGHSEAWTKAAQQVSYTLYSIAVLTLICNAIFIFAAPGGQAGGVELAVTIGFVLLVCAFFAGMGTWALWMPVPAGVLGLVVFIGLFLLDVVAAFSLGGGGSPIAGIVIRVMLIIGLIRNISAAAKAR